MAGSNNNTVGLGINAQVNVTAPNTQATAQGLQRVGQALSTIGTAGKQAQQGVTAAAQAARTSFSTAAAATTSAQKSIQSLGHQVVATTRSLDGLLDKSKFFAKSQSQISAAVATSTQDLNRYSSSVRTAMGAVSNAFTVSGQTAKDYLQAVQSSMAARLTGVWAAMRYARQAGEAMQDIDLLRASMYRITGDQQITAQSMQYAADVAHRYSINLKDVASAMVELARQGRSMSDIQILTENLAQVRLLLATSTGRLMGMSDMIAHVTTLMNQLDLSTAEAVRGLRIMAQMDIETASSFDRIGQALNKFAATGKMARMTMDEIIMAATAFTEAGFTGEQAGTALNTILSRVGRNKEALDFMQQFGVELTKVKDGVYTVNNSMDMLLTTYDTLKRQGKFMEMREFLNMYAGTRMQSKLIAGLEVMIRRREDYNKTIERATQLEAGTDNAILVQRALDEMLRTIESKKTQVANAFNTVFIQPQFMTAYKAFLTEMVGIASSFAQTTTDMTRGILGIAGFGDAERGLATLAGLFKMYLLIKIPATVMSGLKYLASTMSLYGAELAGSLQQMLFPGFRLEDSLSGPGLAKRLEATIERIKTARGELQSLANSLSRMKLGAPVQGLDVYFQQMTKTLASYQQGARLRQVSLLPQTTFEPKLAAQTQMSKQAFDRMYTTLHQTVKARGLELREALSNTFKLQPNQAQAFLAQIDKIESDFFTKMKQIQAGRGNRSMPQHRNALQGLLDQFKQTYIPQLQGVLTQANLTIPPIDSAAMLQSFRGTTAEVLTQIRGLRHAFNNILPKDSPLHQQLNGIRTDSYAALQGLQAEFKNTGKISTDSLTKFLANADAINQRYKTTIDQLAIAGQSLIKTTWGPQVQGQIDQMRNKLNTLNTMLATPRIQRSAFAAPLQESIKALITNIQYVEELNKNFLKAQATGKMTGTQMANGMNQVNAALKEIQTQIARVEVDMKTAMSSWKLAIMSVSATLLNIISIVGIITTSVYMLKRAWDWVASSIRDAAGALGDFRQRQKEIDVVTTALGEQKGRVEEERTSLTASRTIMFEAAAGLMGEGLTDTSAKMGIYANRIGDLTGVLENYFRNPELYREQVANWEKQLPGVGAAITNLIDGLITKYDAKGNITQQTPDFTNPEILQGVIKDFLTAFQLPEGIAQKLAETDQFAAGFQQFVKVIAEQLPAFKQMQGLSAATQVPAGEIKKTYDQLAAILPVEVLQKLETALVELTARVDPNVWQRLSDPLKAQEANKLYGDMGKQIPLDLIYKVLNSLSSDKEATNKLLRTIGALIQTQGDPKQMAPILSTILKGNEEQAKRLASLLEAAFQGSFMKDGNPIAQAVAQALGQQDKTLVEFLQLLTSTVTAQENLVKESQKAVADSASTSTIDSAVDTFTRIQEEIAKEEARINAKVRAEELKHLQEKGDEAFQPSKAIQDSWIALAQRIAAEISVLEGSFAGKVIPAEVIDALNQLKDTQAAALRAAIQARPKSVRVARDPSRDMLSVVKDDYEAAKAMIDSYFQFREDAAGKIIDLQDRTRTPEAFREHIKNLEKYIADLEKLTSRGDAAFRSRVGKELEKARLERKKTIFHLEQSQIDIIKESNLIKLDLMNQKLRETKDLVSDVSRMELLHDSLQLTLETAALDLQKAGGGAEAYQLVMDMLQRMNTMETAANVTAGERLILYKNLEQELVNMLLALSEQGVVLDAKLIQPLKTLLEKVKEARGEIRTGLFDKSQAALDVAFTSQDALDSYDNHRMTMDFNRNLTGQTDVLDRRLAAIQNDQERLLSQVLTNLQIGPESSQEEVVGALTQIKDVLLRGVEREISAMQAAGAAGVGPLMSSRQIQEYAEKTLNPEAIQQVVQQYIQKAMESLRAAGVSETVLAELESSGAMNDIKRVLTDIVTKGAKQVLENLKQAQQELMDAIQAGWEEGFNIGFEHGFTEEGYKAMKDMIIRKIGQYISQTLSKLISETIADGLSEAFSGMGGFMSGSFGKAFGGLVGNIFGSLIGFAIGGFFNQFRDKADAMAEQQRKAQRDRVTASGFDWSYREAEKATPYYEFSPPVTQESVKIVKFVNNFSITTDAAMAMINQQRELERVIQEIVTGMNRTLAKTTGVVI